MIERLKESKTFYICLSVLLAIIFWMYVRESEDPVMGGTIWNVPVELTGESVLASQGLAVAEVSHDKVDLKVSAPASVLDHLSRKNVSAILDVSKCVAGENTLYYTPKVASTVNTDGTTWVGQAPETIVVRVEKLDSKIFPVEFQLSGSVAEGYQADTAAIEPATVTISGPVDQVSQVARVAAKLEVNELSEQYTGNLPLTLYNAKGEVLEDLEISLDAESVYVVLPVVVIRDIDLSVKLISGGGADESNASYKIQPESITVSGSAEAMKGLSELSLGSVDLSKVNGTKVISFPISLQPQLKNVSGITTANVTVTVSGLQTRSLDVDNISLINHSSAYEVSLATQMCTVVIRGREEDLATIDPSQIRVVVDLSDITTVGTYPVPASVYLDTSDSVGVVGEYSIVVSISR